MSRSKNELLLMALALLTAACAVIAGTFEAPPLKAQRTAAVYAELPGEEENADAAEARINLNTASPQELTALEGIGEAKAQAIISYRTEHGDFLNIEEVLCVKGIGEKTFEKIKDDICV